ncbi:MAG: TIGR01459 family HAD-type hydrolase [Planctomycetota bacterium]
MVQTRDEMELPTSLDALRGRYDAVLCDLWGVVHNGVHAFPAAVAALQRWRASGGHVVLLSNVPKPRGPIPAQLDRLHVPRDAWDVIVTSGDATRAELARRAPGPMHLIGTEADAPLWAGLGMARAGLGEATFVCVTGLADFFHGRPEDHRAELEAARARGLDLVCANPDIVVRHGEHLHWCAGALARDYAALGGTVVVCGKPHPPIYALALDELARLSGANGGPRRVLAIGDGPATDMRGANAQGLDALFIAAGINEGTLGAGAALDVTRVEAALVAEGAHARFALAHLM